MVNNWIVR